MLGKTVVNIEVKRLKSQPLPAITVCIPALFSISKLSNLNENKRELYQNYELLINESIINNTMTKEVHKKTKRYVQEYDKIVSSPILGQFRQF